MPKLYGLQFLRAFAAISVLIGHAIAEAEHYFDLSLNTGAIPWTRGVDIFFVISGFIITLSARRFANRPVAFFWRRFLRVAPLYYLFTTLMVITLLALPNEPKDTIFDLKQIISSYAFFPYPRADARIAPLLSLGWTLNYEMFFYAICAFSLMLRRSTLAMCLALIGFSAANLVFDIDSIQWRFWTNPILIEFVFGVLLAKAYLAGWHHPNYMTALAIFGIGIAMIILLDASQLPRFIAAGVPAAIITSAGALFFPNTTGRFQILGDASYALYLSHRFTLRIGTILLVPILPNSNIGALFYVVSISLLAICIGVLVHLWLERPLLNHTTKRAFA